MLYTHLSTVPDFAGSNIDHVGLEVGAVWGQLRRLGSIARARGQEVTLR